MEFQVILTALPAWKFEPGKCNETLLAQFKSSTLVGFGLKNNSLSVRAAGAIVQYLKETQPDALILLTTLRSYSLSEFMTLDASTRRNLELDETLRGERKGSLLGTLDFAITPMGKRLIHQWVSQPLLQVGKITQRQDGVQYFFSNGMIRAELRDSHKAACRSGTVGQPYDCRTGTTTRSCGDEKYFGAIAEGRSQVSSLKCQACRVRWIHAKNNFLCFKMQLMMTRLRHCKIQA